MVTVSASHYRVFSVDPPYLPLKAYPGKMVPTGVITDAHRRKGHAYGRYVAEAADDIWYKTAKFCEEFAEYQQARPKKRASEMADILTLIDTALPMLTEDILTPSQVCSMEQMESAWRSFQRELVRKTLPDPGLRFLYLLKRTQQAADAERKRKKLRWADIRTAQQAKAKRIGHYEGWIITHLVLPIGDDFCQKLLDTGWYELQPDELGLFPGLLTANRITQDQLQAVISG